MGWVAALLAFILLLGASVGTVIVLLRRTATDIEARWRAEGVTFTRGPEGASYVGHLQGGIPLRGNGLLALTASDLRLTRYVPRREFVVPLRDVTQVEIRRGWRGKVRLGLPVVAAYYRADGKDDALAFTPRDAPAWAQAIAERAGLSVNDRR